MEKLENLVNLKGKEIAILKQGASFGEGALLNDKPRAATVKCKNNCYFAVLSKKDYSESIGQLQAL